ncbi:LamG-like jellyroll fold domain-containing protein [Mycobacterium sp. M26]|uniref:LamG-like jellyroll fold domain-containing protein n=1 Tax=Mycobacterium sp. M26 TaxID=1762962 RepID=UPI00073EEB17|nr:LamG-like jellyroll fold domain-containing protein [Mycobacterium sp. M26]
MAEPWELVLHHTYSGPPGLVFDHSSTRRCHGQPVGLSDDDYLTDGAQPGSGAIRLNGGASCIRVPSSPSWSPVGGVRVEMLCETDLIRSGGALVCADSFSFGTDQGYFGGQFAQTTGGSSAVAEGGTEPRPLPAADWMTLALQYDPAGVHVEFDGTVVAQWREWNGLLTATAGLVIGNDYTGQNGLTGRIDDLKIWRLNPHFLGDRFVERPLEPEVGRCWAEWSKRLDAVIASNPDCWNRLAVLLPKAMFATMEAISHLPGIESQFAELTLRYQEQWSQGQLGQVSAVLADLVALLRGAGFHPSQIADLQALLNDSCFASLQEQLPINCDVEFTDMFSISESF